MENVLNHLNIKPLYLFLIMKEILELIYLLKEFGLSSLGLRMTLIELQKINSPTPAGLSIIIANESKNK